MLLKNSIKRLMCTRYPRFIFGFQLQQGEIPAFIYHDVDEQTFETDLTFLRDNGYRTLTTEEFVKYNYNVCDNKSVLLTFDDARKNFFKVTFPLLRKFNTRATLFVPTYWIGGRKGPLKAQEDVRPRDDMFMTWDELRTCVRSGLVDVQLHAHRHALVYTSDRLVGFASPKLLAQHHIYDWPMRQNGHNEMLGLPPLGTPIYEAMPLLSAPSRLLEDMTVVRACQDVVDLEGGEGFFTKRDWTIQLRRVHQDTARRVAHPKLMAESEFQSLVASEFQLSQQLFETELGVFPRYFAYPWMLGSMFSLKLAAERGIDAVFGVGLDFRRARRLNGPVPAFGRIKGEWLRFLPGVGRLRLRDVLPEKLRGFLRSQHLAH